MTEYQTQTMSGRCGGLGLLGSPNHELRLRIHGGRREGQLATVKAAKCTIGSSASCSLPLAGPGIQPIHCLLLRGQRGSIVRSLAAGTTLNGAPVQDATLLPGDRLRIGPYELEVLSDQPSDHRPDNRPADELPSATDPDGPRAATSPAPCSRSDEIVELLTTRITGVSENIHQLTAKLTETDEQQQQLSDRVQDYHRAMQEGIDECVRQLTRLEAEFNAQRQPDDTNLVELRESIRALQAQLADDRPADRPLDRRETGSAPCRTLDPDPATLPEMRPHPALASRLDQLRASRVEAERAGRQERAEASVHEIFRHDVTSPQAASAEPARQPTEERNETSMPSETDTDVRSSLLSELNQLSRRQATRHAPVAAPQEASSGDFPPSGTPAAAANADVGSGEPFAAPETVHSEQQLREEEPDDQYDDPAGTIDAPILHQHSDVDRGPLAATSTEETARRSSPDPFDAPSARNASENPVPAATTHEAPVTASAVLSRLGRLEELTAGDEPDAAPSGLPNVHEQPRAADPPTGPLTGPETADVDEDDASIEAYMSQLLARARGGEPAPPAPVNVVRTAVEPTWKPNQAKRPAAAEPPGDGPIQYLPRSQAPEQGSKLSAMRELANDSTRSAIATHAKMSGFDMANAKRIAGMAAFGFSGLALLYITVQPVWSILGALGGIGIGSFWFWQARNLKRRAESSTGTPPSTDTTQPSHGPSEQPATTA